MLRFIWVIVSCLFLIMYYVPKMSYYARHPEKYGEDICYQMAQVINDVSTEIKAGRRYILFPEGGYDHSHNELKEFMPGSFKIAKKAKCPIVPVVLYDSFKPFEGWSLRRVTTQLAFLEPIPYEVIADKTTTEIRDMVVDKIQRKLDTMETMNCW